MNWSALLKLPLFWLLVVGLLLLAVLSFWYVRRPVDANGHSLILRPKAERALRRDLSQQGARRALDSARAVRAEEAATTLYRAGQQNEAAARRLHQRVHETPATADTAAGQLQRELSDY